MSTLATVGRHVRRAATRRSRDRVLAALHPAVRDEVLTRWESEAR
ncbi:hypothetical protein [Blastococcus sp. URHD0036]|nr:hypothetical protein [Blastococcus sp. URHD0036]